MNDEISYDSPCKFAYLSIFLPERSYTPYRAWMDRDHISQRYCQYGDPDGILVKGYSETIHQMLTSEPASRKISVTLASKHVLTAKE